MKRTRQLTAALLGAFTLTTVLTAGGAYELTSFTIDGGGGRMAAGSFHLEGTIGQHDAGLELVGDEFAVCGGFWPAAADDPPTVIDLDGNGDVGFTDLVILLGGWGPCAPPPCLPDIDGNGDVGFTDLVVLLAAWGPVP